VVLKNDFIDTDVTAIVHAAHHNNLATAANTALQEIVNTVTTSGATQTIPDPVTGPTISRITLTAACTLTFPTAGAGKTFTVVLVQNGTGNWAVTWPTVKWASGVAPTLTLTAGAVDWLTFACVDGATWAGFPAGFDIK
jgi:hypothetical protein